MERSPNKNQSLPLHRDCLKPMQLEGCCRTIWSSCEEWLACACKYRGLETGSDTADEFIQHGHSVELKK